ncbi:MAG: terminase large subunit domain-containing protein [Gemmiger sp.]
MKLELTLTAKQKQFVDAADVDEVLFGGAAGGGKSYGQLADALLYALRWPGSRQLILRRSYPDLERSLVQAHLAFWPKNCYKYSAARHEGTFTNGSVVEFGYCAHEQDVYRYQGAEYDVIRFDELTHFTESMYRYLLSRVRGAKPFPRQVKSTTNPGGVGHAWVKARFVDGAVPGRVRQTPGGTRLFLPSLVQDNPFLMRGDPGYVRRLESLPEQQRKALLCGEWDLFEGQVFREWKNDPAHYVDRLWTHVIEPFAIPAWWKVWRGFDFGYARPFSVGWYAADGDGKLYRIREWYGCTGEPNVGVRMTPQQIAAGIRQIESEDPNLKGRRIQGVADPAIFDESRGQSIAAMMLQSPNFIYWHGGDNTRLAGKMQFHYRLAFDEQGETMFQVFNTCAGFLRTVPALCYSRTNPEDVDTGQEDHIYDECRYVLMEHPISPRERHAPPNPGGDDPLNLHRPVRVYRV